MFKKAFNAVSNACATEFAIKTPPSFSNNDGKQKLFDAMVNQLNVKYFYNREQPNYHLSFLQFDF